MNTDEHQHTHSHLGHSDRNPDGICYTHHHPTHPDRPARGCPLNPVGGVVYPDADDSIAHAHAYPNIELGSLAHTHTHSDDEPEGGE